jgi:hypothetical protein
VQAGVRARPMKGLIGPFLDLHVRHSHFEGLTWTLDADLEHQLRAEGGLGGALRFARHHLEDRARVRRPA